MRRILYVLCPGLIAASIIVAAAGARAAETPAAAGGTGSKSVEVTADQSLEWYQEQHLYVARGNARAVRGDLTVEADILTAHERELPAGTAQAPAGNGGTGDVDKMTAEGHVRISTAKAGIWGEHGVYDLERGVAHVTGGNLKYQTAEETVTARDSLEYWENAKLAVARGNARAVRGDRRIESDVLTVRFRETPNGQTQAHTMTATGHVTVITGNDVARSDKAVYDISRNIAVLTGHVRITRADGTQLNGDVGEVDFAANQSRLMNEGSGRVKALLTPKTASAPGVSPVKADRREATPLR